MGALWTWKPRTIDIRGHQVAVYDITPAQLRSRVPVIICPGFVEVPESWRRHIELLVGYGYRVIAFDAPHGLPLPVQEGICGSILGHVFIERQKMMTLVGIMESLGIPQADLVARSEGALWAIHTAYRYPNLVRDIVLMNPAGLIGRGWHPPFLIRWLQDIIQTKRDELGEKPFYAPVPADTVMAQSWWNTAREILALISADSLAKLRLVKSDGHKVVLITTEYDRLFPLELIERYTKGLINVTGILKGSHTSFFSLGRIEEFANAIAMALESLGRKY
jgi:pimeloyl-ACP methyl ester carboxylesterase